LLIGTSSGRSPFHSLTVNIMAEDKEPKSAAMPRIKQKPVKPKIHKPAAPSAEEPKAEDKPAATLAEDKPAATSAEAKPLTSAEAVYPDRPVFSDVPVLEDLGDEIAPQSLRWHARAAMAILGIGVEDMAALMREVADDLDANSPPQ
jgi:hypothetical protein